MMPVRPAVPLALALLLAACGARSEVPATAAAAGPPQRIVPASAGVVDLVAALVPPERIAGLPSQALLFSAAGARPADPALLERPRFGAYAAEAVLALSPDLVVCDRWQRADTTERLREAGVRVVELDDLESLASVRAALQQLGELLGAQAACAATLADLDARVARLAGGAAHRARWRALAYSNGGGGGWLAGGGTTADEWIRLTGMLNAGAEGGRQGHVRCSFEELLALDPDLIVVSARGENGEPGLTAQVLRSEPGLASLRAVRLDRIVALEAWLYSAIGPQLVTAAETLAPLADAAMERR